MFKTLRNAWKIEDLRRKMIFTLIIIVIFRLGVAMPVPFLDPSAISSMVNETGSMLGYINLLTGGAFSQATLFALSVQPYINASIIIQLLTVALPPLERLAQEGEEGRRKINRITRYTGAGIALALSIAYYFLLKGQGSLEYTTGWQAWFAGAVIVLAYTAGSMLIMWLGEQIDKNGIGNGISLLIFAGIVSNLFKWSVSGVGGLFQGTMHPVAFVAIVVVALVMIVAVTFVDMGERRVPVQYSKRMVGRKMYGGQSTHIPMKVNSTGVLPLIFAFSMLQFPGTIIAFFPTSGVYLWWNNFMNGWVYQIVLALLILGFTFFYTSITFNPVEISKNMQQYGGTIPGIRQGKPTSDYLSRVSGRLTLFGALFLAVLATLPTLITNMAQMSVPFAASSILIAVSVAIETMRQLESQMLMRHYKGFL